MPDPIHVIHEIPDPALRQLARDIRTHRLSRQAALSELESFRAAVPFDSGDRLTLELLRDEIDNLTD